MTIKLTSTDQVSSSSGVKCLVFGGSGVGKTFLCSTAPNPVILSAEKGLLSLRKQKVAAIEIRTLTELYEAYQWCVSSKEAQQFWTICLDSITEMAEVVLSNLVKTVGAKDPRKAYGEIIPQMSELIRAFRDLPGKHVCVTAKMETAKDEMTGVIQYGPSMPGAKLGPALPYFFDEVFALRIGGSGNQTYRYLQTQPDIQYVSKDRSGALNPIEEPNLTVLFNKILTP
jgi:hypothetical protein